MKTLAETLKKTIVILKDIQSISNTADTKTIEDKMIIFVDLEEVINSFPIQSITLTPNKELYDDYMQLKRTLKIN